MSLVGVSLVVQDGMHGDRRTEGPIKVDAWALCEPSNNLMGLVEFKSAICVELVLEYPLPRKDVSPWRMSNKIPGVVV